MTRKKRGNIVVASRCATVSCHQSCRFVTSTSVYSATRKKKDVTGVCELARDGQSRCQVFFPSAHVVPPVLFLCSSETVETPQPSAVVRCCLQLQSGAQIQDLFPPVLPLPLKPHDFAFLLGDTGKFQNCHFLMCLQLATPQPAATHG